MPNAALLRTLNFWLWIHRLYFYNDHVVDLTFPDDIEHDLEALPNLTVQAFILRRKQMHRKGIFILLLQSKPEWINHFGMI